MDFEFTMHADVNINSRGEILKRRGLEKNGMAQQVLDNLVLQTCAPYVPFDTGMLRDSGTIHTVIGSGVVQYKTPYARKQYYENKGGLGLRGKMWFERAKADHLAAWGRAVEDVTGGEVTLF